jgi:TATA-box binding protein (TBP), component of TFIID and TFIIIB
MNLRCEDTIRIENIVASARVAESLDLSALCEQYRDAEYDRRRFPGVIVRMHDPRMAALVFGTGRVILTGVKTTRDLEKGLFCLGEKLRVLDPAIDAIPSYVVQNIVASADLGVPLNLTRIAIGFDFEHVEYDPEQFSGLIYRMADPKVVALLFCSGKMIVNGCKVPDDAKRAVAHITTALGKIGIA